MDIIERCALKETYLTDRTSLREYKRLYWYPDLFDYSLLRTSNRKMKSLVERAKEIAREKIAEHDFRLEEDNKKKSEGIFEEAIKETPSASHQDVYDKT